jgi:hypothetical protein
MQTTLSTTAIPVVEIGHERRTVFLAALAALSVTLAVAITAATVTDGSSRPAVQAGAAAPWVTPQHGPGSNSLSPTDASPTATPWVTPQYGPGSNSLSPTGATPTATPWVTPQYGPGSNSLSATSPLG